MHTVARLVMASALAGVVILTTDRPAGAQLSPGELSVAVGYGTNVEELRQWDATVDGMTRTGELVVVSRQDDRSLPGRTHEYLAQFHEGVRVRGGGVSRQLDGGVTVSVFGTLYTDIDVETAPALGAGEAASRLVQRIGVAAVDRPPGEAVILPLIGGWYELAYPLTLEDGYTYFTSAADGAVVLREAAFDTQSVGTGAGFLGDMKKVSATPEGGRFEARDRLRPGEVVTLDAGFDVERLVRLIEPGPFRVQRWTSSDIAADGDNDWGDAAVVDGHVHMGWTYDYFAQRHGWEGLDGRNGRIVGIVNNSFFNAVAWRPPFGPEGAGVYVFGRRGIPDSERTQPRVALHTVAHELMHGLTWFSVSDRTGGGLINRLGEVGRLGPPSFEWEGETYNCPETSFPIEFEPDVWEPIPALCSEDGRFVLASSQAGGVNEAYSDIFGVSTGFFHEGAGAAGTYEYGSEYAAGTLRSLSNPWSSFDSPAYPARFEFAIVLFEIDGERYYTYSGALFLGGRFVAFDPEYCCYGAQHWNSTILSHAFYLALEGGTNLVTEITVEGAGASSRVQVERIFFRALTELMPQVTSFPLAADVIRQAAADLADGTDVQRAIEDALVAVGLPPLPPEPAG